ncbi:hypothetical protein VTJ04DRAFT_4071 [Mycothermus thermophilus]|uniref:uncharacterized protein n=1 Tax=Humicola insolens TaxID=85995 RepID=UPI0037448002
MAATELTGEQLAEYIEVLIAAWRQCIRELQQLQEAADAAGRPVRGLNSLLKIQQRALDKVIQKQSSESASISPAQYFGIKSCCWDDRWAVVKRCRGLVAVNKDFPRSPRLPVGVDEGWLAYKDQPFQEKPVAIDAVVDSGATWIKFISVSPKTLEYQVVAEGWESDADSEAGDDQASDEGLRHTEFADTVSKIVLAARWNHCPRVHLILPSLHEGQSELVDRLLRFVRKRMGGPDVAIDISCADSLFFANPTPPLEDAINALIQDRDPLVGDDCGRLTETVNLDPSALVALVTDLHHGPVPRQPECQQDIIRRSLLDHESDNNELVARRDILPEVVYPALRGRRLVCTKAAASYFRRLVSAISTHSEEVRAGFVLPPDSATPVEPEDLRKGLGEWSNLPVPNNLHLPVEVVPDVDVTDVDSAVTAGILPPMASGVARDLSPLNRSVYCYGWMHRLTTVTGHRGIERQVTLAVARHWDRNDPRNDVPPDVWHRHLGGYLIHRDKPRGWREMIPGGEVPEEVARWALPWTTWGRGISTYGLPDTKTWEGVGHSEKTGYGRRMARREGRQAETVEEEEEVEQS